MFLRCEKGGCAEADKERTRKWTHAMPLMSVIMEIRVSRTINIFLFSRTYSNFNKPQGRRTQRPPAQLLKFEAHTSVMMK